jgi:hypothetical protein
MATSPMKPGMCQRSAALRATPFPAHKKAPDTRKHPTFRPFPWASEWARYALWISSRRTRWVQMRCPRLLPCTQEGPRCAKTPHLSTFSLGVRVGQMRERRNLEVGHSTKWYMPGFQIPPDKADGPLWRPGVMRQPHKANPAITPTIIPAPTSVG